MTKQYNLLFKKLKIKKEGCFIPFVVLGDPSFNISLQIIDTLIQSGADALELGIPFSDPIADGITIQKAHTRAFLNKMTLKKCFLMLKMIKKKYPLIPIGLLVYANIIFSYGISKFYHLCSLIKINSILIADIPYEESQEIRKAAQENNILQVFICPPDANHHVIKKISEYSQGYVYLVSRPGITGLQKSRVEISLTNTIKKLKKYHSQPIIQGFGIFTSDQIKKSLNNGVKGIICGSLFATIIEKNFINHIKLIKKIKKITIKLKHATKKYFKTLK
ncbi:tryptophan synthase subunit alpha [Buchnera aphidicola]|uniref:tryptophan synthase subunit alpha n=1 Tax=Buchnera aphidicola TaxID=9 RepID=UPI00094C4618|nr:tryptophan synthase subunit alpha [Buchnera aphidicola]